MRYMLCCYVSLILLGCTVHQNTTIQQTDLDTSVSSATMKQTDVDTNIPTKNLVPITSHNQDIHSPHMSDVSMPDVPCVDTPISIVEPAPVIITPLTDIHKNTSTPTDISETTSDSTDMPENYPSEEKVIPQTISKKIVILPGKYHVSSEITIEKSGHLILSPGVEILLDEVGITCYGQLSAKGSSAKPIIFDGSPYWENISVIGHDAYARLEHCHIFNGLGKQAHKTEEGEWSLEGGNSIVGGALVCFQGSFAELKNCRFEKNDGQGTIAALQARKLIIQNCEISYNHGHGIFCDGVAITLMSNNILSNKQFGILLANTTGDIQHNVIGENTYGIVLEEENNLKIVGNTLYKIIVGIESRKNSMLIIEKNIIKESRTGILAIDDTQCEIIGNEIIDTIFGIYLAQHVHAKIVQNTLQNVLRINMLFIEFPVVELKGNSMLAGQYSILYTKTVTISSENNVIKDCDNPEMMFDPTVLKLPLEDDRN